MSRILPVILVTAFVLAAGASGFAQEQTTAFNKDTDYDIYYEVNQGRVDCVRNVKITGLTTIEGKSFLVIKSAEFLGKDRSGYILFEIVKAVLPSKEIRLDTQLTNKE